MTTTERVGAIATAEKIRELVEKAPAGGIFHDAKLSDVGGLEVPGFTQAAGFLLTLADGTELDVSVTGTA